MELPFITLDVFTRTRFRGNPLAVVTIPASGPQPTQEQKQAIAREFNLSETVFIHDVADPAADRSRRIDIFLTVAEIPFAGHPTIGAAVSLLPQGVTQVVTKAGPIPIVQTGPDSVSATVPHNVHLHATTFAQYAGIASSDLQLNDAVRSLELAAPVFSLVKGMTFALIELPSLELLAQVSAGSATDFKAEGFLDDGWQTGFIGRFYYVRTGTSTADGGIPVVQLRTRMVSHGFEDPATGSASSCLGAFLSIHGGDKQTTTTRRYEFTQGVEMGKESSIVVDVNLKDGALDTVTLAGPAIQVMRGHVTVQ
ncbi:phenazine biosynthesis [Trichoderma arundinaceum]|uniref:Phenazine biosynthesis n=1 Tax=Trichoderma arundinaceum TaxID=490622 RepID=A0A395NF56_TRIAR|nr:phenazine biosynthesis [Trichoderma arundinaceum]